MRSSILVLSATILAFSTAAPRAAVLEVPAQFPTVSAALANALQGDEIVVATGTYSPSTNGESFPLDVPDGVWLRSESEGAAILDAESSAGVFLLDGPGSARVSGFEITGGNAENGGGFQITAGSHEVDHNRILSCGALRRGSAVNVEGTATPWIHHNVAWRAFDTDLDHPGDPHVFQFGGDSGGLAEHNLIGRGDSNGLFVFQNGGPAVRHNILFDNGIDGLRGRGICFDGNDSTVIAYNLFYENSISSLVMRNPSGAFQNVDAQTANDFFPDDGVYGNIDGDPLLANPEGGDFRLLTGSAAIDAGDPESPTDPDGSVVDIGPLTFDPTAGTTPALVDRVRFVAIAPNPFNPRTTITIESPRESVGILDVFDARGRRVRRLHQGSLPSGRAAFDFDGLDDEGRGLPSAVYMIRIVSGDGIATGKMTLVR